MSEEEWRKAWIQTLIHAGIFIDTAEDAFDVCYGNQQIDLTADPEEMARAFIPTQLNSMAK